MTQKELEDLFIFDAEINIELGKNPDKKIVNNLEPNPLYINTNIKTSEDKSDSESWKHT